jgi:hypothetical protein
MDQTSLVEHQIDDVTRIIDELKVENFGVNAAFWLYTSEADQWFLYIVSDIVDEKGIAEAYRLLYSAMRRLPNLWINRFEVKLVDPKDPAATAIIEFAKSQETPLPTWVRGTRLGDVYIERAYIYGDTKLAYGNLTTGQVVGARRIRPTVSDQVLFEPALPGPANPADWVPGVLGPDGKFHPGDHSRKPATGAWAV